MRDLCRTRADMVADRMRARHRLSKLLLRHGRVWRDGKAWTLAHERWLLTQHFAEQSLQTTYDHYRAVPASRDAQLEAIEADLAVWQDRAPFAEQVARLAAYRGVTRLGALHLAAEVADWRRFARASAFMGFCGLVPSEYSSGQVTRRGHITKAGNVHLRTQLAWVGLGLPAPPQRRRPAGQPAAGPRPPGGGPSMGRPAPAVRAVPTPPGPQALPQHRRHRHRPGAGRVPLGRDDRLRQYHRPPCVLIGHQGGHHRHDVPGHRRRRTDPRHYYALRCGRRRRSSGAPSCGSPTCGPNPRTSGWRLADPCRPGTSCRPQSPPAPSAIASPCQPAAHSSTCITTVYPHASRRCLSPGKTLP